MIREHYAVLISVLLIISVTFSGCTELPGPEITEDFSSKYEVSDTTILNKLRS
jgi:hypothetical protein